jgi:hypothetical protein
MIVLWIVDEADALFQFIGSDFLKVTRTKQGFTYILQRVHKGGNRQRARKTKAQIMAHLQRAD